MRYRHSTVAEKAYGEKSCLFPNHASPQNFEDLPTKYPKTLKPDMQWEWPHLLYKCKVKNTLCGKAVEMEAPRPHRNESCDRVANLCLPPQLYLVINVAYIIIVEAQCNILSKMRRRSGEGETYQDLSTFWIAVVWEMLGKLQTVGRLRVPQDSVSYHLLPDRDKPDKKDKQPQILVYNSRKLFAFKLLITNSEKSLNSKQQCPTFGQYLVGIFDRVVVCQGRSLKILGGPPKFLRPGGPETPFPALSDKYFCQKGKSVNWSSFHACLHAWYLPLVRNAWEV